MDRRGAPKTVHRDPLVGAMGQPGDARPERGQAGNARGAEEGRLREPGHAADPRAWDPGALDGVRGEQRERMAGRERHPGREPALAPGRAYGDLAARGPRRHEGGELLHEAVAARPG